MTELKYWDKIEVTKWFFQWMKGYLICEQGGKWENYLAKLITNEEEIRRLQFKPKYIEALLNKSVFIKI